MSFGANKKKSGRSVLSQLRTSGRKGPKSYRPLGSFPFPDVRGKVVADLYLTMKSYLKCVTLCFDDNTELVIDVEPYLSFKANYSDWKTGNQHVIKRWPRIDVTPTPPKNPSRRPLGLYRGQIWIAPDFDAPLMLVKDPEAKRFVSDRGNRAKKANKRT
jgi:hypothetical protein